MSKVPVNDDVAATIDVIEEGYQFLLAYAAQGRHSDQGFGSGPNPRAVLEAMSAALERLPDLVRERVAAMGSGHASEFQAFVDAFDRDADVARAAIGLVLAQPHIGSQLVDNLNASIHLRALLTDIFLIDETLGA